VLLVELVHSTFGSVRQLQSHRSEHGVLWWFDFVKREAGEVW